MHKFVLKKCTLYCLIALAFIMVIASILPIMLTAKENNTNLNMSTYQTSAESPDPSTESPDQTTDPELPQPPQDLTLGKNSVVVDIYDRNDQRFKLINLEDYSGNRVFTSQWENSKEFKIKYKIDPNNKPEGKPNPKNPEKSMWTMKFSVSYSQSYKFSNKKLFHEEVLKDNVLPKTEDNLEALEQHELSFMIDGNPENEEANQGINTENEVAPIKGWGIYKFSININNYESDSLFFAVEPTRKIKSAPQVQYNQTTDKTSMHYGYDFYLLNADEYKYIDQTTLKWYIKGKSADGAWYALTPNDLNIGHSDLVKCTKSLWKENYPRNGVKFEFRDNGVEGVWQVWCEYKYKTAEEETPAEVIQSVKTEVSTKITVDLSYIIYIVAALAVVSIIITVVIAVVRKKKEKVW